MSNLLFDPVFYRTYSRPLPLGKKESFPDVAERAIKGLEDLGHLPRVTAEQLKSLLLSKIVFPSGRWLWCGGTPWLDSKRNAYGAYNCTSLRIRTLEDIAQMMNLSMCGTGTGAILEIENLKNLPTMFCKITIEHILGISNDKGASKATKLVRTKSTTPDSASFTLTVGDSRQGWVRSVLHLLELAAYQPYAHLKLSIDLSNVRGKGQTLKGFGGTSNPIKLAGLYPKLAKILNGAIANQDGRLNSIDVSRLIDECALVVVAGNIRRSAGIRQGALDDTSFVGAKKGMWIQDGKGNWKIDPSKDALRMANHTIVYHTKPTEEECVAAVEAQYTSGEGAIMFAPEAIARANADLFSSDRYRKMFIAEYVKAYASAPRDRALGYAQAQVRQVAAAIANKGEGAVASIVKRTSAAEWDDRGGRYGLNPCFSGDTLVRTKGGNVLIRDLVGKTVEIWDGNGWVICDNFRVTDTRRGVYTVVLNSGDSINATANHTFILVDGTRKPLIDLVCHQDALMLAHPSADDNNNWNTVKDWFYRCIEENVYCCTVHSTNAFELGCGVMVGNCGEIILADNLCNLSEVHLVNLAPDDDAGQAKAFYTAGTIGAILLHHEFDYPKMQWSREVDPIVGVSFTGLFDFFVIAFGVEWLEWWQEGRDRKHPSAYTFLAKEKSYLNNWRQAAWAGVKSYCRAHNLRLPNRVTTVQPAGCLTKEALRVFDKGLLYADEQMGQGLGIVDIDPLQLREGKYAANRGVSNPLRHDLVKLCLSHGRQLTLTPEHRLFVNGAWVRADRLVVGDALEFEIGTYRNTCDRQLPHSHVPTMTPDLAYFIAVVTTGAFRVQGSTTKITSDNYGFMLSLRKKVLSLFDSAKEVGPTSVPLCWRTLVLKGTYLAQWIRDFKIWGKRVNRAVRGSSRNSVLSFFAGFFDVLGKTVNGQLSVTWHSEEFLRNLQQIGEAVGLLFAIKVLGDKTTLTLIVERSDQESMLYFLRSSAVFGRKDCMASFEAEKPFMVKTIETNISDYTYDIIVDTPDDNEAWYWQGAIKSHNTKSLLTGSSPGWHPPKAAYYLRRITFGKGNPVALACLDLGYSVVPSQSDTDSSGALLDNPFDDKCTEWLVEIPCKTLWADLPGASEIDINKFSALAQLDFFMQVQTEYTDHNTSATIELRKDEIEPLGKEIYRLIQEDKGYVSAALLARFDDLQSFPRLPFEPITKEIYENLLAEVSDRAKFSSFEEAYDHHSNVVDLSPQSPAGCDSDRCLIGSFPSAIGAQAL